MKHQLPTICCVFMLMLNAISDNVLRCQQLSSADSLFFANVRRELSLNDQQIFQVDSIMRSYSTELNSLEKENTRISRSDISQEEKAQQQSALLTKKKELKSEREQKLRFLFTREQQDLYDAKIKPGKPAVIHMGINHDRVNCNVCLPK